MTDEHVDALLADLDHALAVEPSPSVAAKARTRFELASGSGLRWRLLAAAGVVMAVTMAVTGSLVWPRSSELSSPPVGLVSRPVAESVRQPVTQTPAPTGTPQQRPVDRQVPFRALSRAREPEVLIPADQWLALRQLAESLQNGRIDQYSLPTEIVVSADDDLSQDGTDGPEVVRKLTF